MTAPADGAWNVRVALAALGSLAEAVTVMDATGRTIYLNQAAVELLRIPSAETLTSAPPGETAKRFAITDEHGRPVAYEDFPSTRILAGERDVPPLLVRNVVMETGEERWLVQKSTAILDDGGALERVVNVIEDVTDVKKAEIAQRLLASASEELSASLDYERTLQRVAEMAVPGLADWCTVDLPGRGRRIDMVALAHTDPERVRSARELRERHHQRLDAPGGLAAVIRSGRSEIYPDASAEQLDEIPAEDQRLLREVGLRSLMIVPLRAGARTLGAITLGISDSPRRFDDADRGLAEELGRRAGTAVAHARLYTERARIAHELQQGLRPPDLPAPPGWAAATLYHPAGELNEVGGDFFDVFEVPDGWTALIGDVAGQGAQAAARTALARYTLRTAAELDLGPAAAIEQLNRTLRAQPEMALCTAVCIRLQTHGEGATATLACAGHPLPLLVRDGAVTPVGDPGTIAGVFDEETWPSATLELQPEDLLVLYTDGVLDAVGDGERFGEERLAAAVAEAPPTAEGVVAHLTAGLAAFERGPRRDDTAVLALQLRGARAIRAATGAPAHRRDVR